MACYFGCSTVPNKVAYTVYLLLLVVALGGSLLAAFPTIRRSPLGSIVFWGISPLLTASRAIMSCSCPVLVASWGISTSQCVSNLQSLPACAVLQNVTATPDIEVTDQSSLQGALGEACKDLGFANGTADYTDCTDCLTVAANCFIVAWPLLVSAIVLSFLTLLPCFYCCCCSTNPTNAYEKNKL